MCSGQRSQAFELATTIERLQVGGGNTVHVFNSPPSSRSCHLEFSLALKSKESGLPKSKNCLAKTNVILVLGSLSNNESDGYENVTLKIVQVRPVKRSEDSNYFKLD